MVMIGEEARKILERQLAELRDLAQQIEAELDKMDRKVYVVHEHERSEGSTILLVSDSKDLAERFARDRRKSVKTSIDEVDVDEVEFL